MSWRERLPSRFNLNRQRPSGTAERLVTATQRRLAVTTLLVLAALLGTVGITTAVLVERQLDASVDRTLEAAALAELDRLHEAAGAPGASAEPGEQGSGDGSVGGSGATEGSEQEGDGGGPTSTPNRAATPSPARVTPAPVAIASLPSPSLDADDHSPAAADTFFLYLDAGGAVVQNPERIALAGLPDRAAVASATAAGRDLRTVNAGPVRVRLLTLPLSGEDVTSGAARTLQAGFVLTLHDDQADTLLRAILVVSLAGLLGAAVVSVLLTRRALIPVRAAFERERRFVAASSHELRTPIAVIRSTAEVLAREGKVAPDGARLLADIVAEADRLGGLVAELADLAVAQAKPAAIVGPVDLADVAADIAHRARPMAEAAGLWLEATPRRARSSSAAIAIASCRWR